MTWNDLRPGDTVEIYGALMTILQAKKRIFTWLYLESGNTLKVDYSDSCDFDYPIDKKNDEGEIISRFVARP